MIDLSRFSLVRGFALGAAFACLASTASLAQSRDEPAPSWLQKRVDGLEQKLAFFGGRDEPAPGPSNAQPAQSSMADIAVRLDRLENQMRQLNGRLDELGFQARKNDENLKKFQGDVQFQLDDLSKGGGGGGGGGKSQKRGDAGDSGGGGPSGGGGGSRGGDINVGSNGGSGAPPANLGQTRSSGGGGGRNGDSIGGLIDEGGPGDDPNGPMSIRPPGAGGDSGGGYSRNGGGDRGDDSQMASREPPVTAGNGGARDQFDLGVGFVQRRNYEQAESTFRDFLRSYPNDAKAPEARYWLGESLYQRKKYTEATIRRWPRANRR